MRPVGVLVVEDMFGLLGIRPRCPALESTRNEAFVEPGGTQGLFKVVDQGVDRLLGLMSGDRHLDPASSAVDLCC